MSGTIYDTDSKAVTAAQKAINAAGRTPPLTVNGTYDAPTQAGAEWLWTQGSTGAFSGHIDDDFLNAVGIDPVKGGYAGAAAHTDTKAVPPPGGGGSTTTRNVLLAAAGTGALIGGGFGGVPGAIVGALAGAIGGLFAIKGIISASPPPPPAA